MLFERYTCEVMNDNVLYIVSSECNQIIMLRVMCTNNCRAVLLRSSLSKRAHRRLGIPGSSTLICSSLMPGVMWAALALLSPLITALRLCINLKNLEFK